VLALWSLARTKAYRDPSTIDQFEAILAELGPTGRTLELARGSGIWTALLAGRVTNLTAVDSSSEMLARARDRLGTTQVSFVAADLFRWHPQERYDTFFFALWLSHVPPGRFESFWQMVGEALASSGRALLVDTGPQEASHETLVGSNSGPDPVPLPAS
jgi:trans-aconitate methyltransferase